MPTPRTWHKFQRHLERLRDEEKRPIFSNAHQTMGLQRYYATVEYVATHLASVARALRGASAEAAFWLIHKTIENVGPFFAWQIVCDLIEAGLIKAAEEDRWVALGPGALAGLERVFSQTKNEDASRHKGAQTTTKKSKMERNIEKCRLLADLAPEAFRLLDLPFYHIRGRRLTLKNIEHCLCEFAKYCKEGNSKHRNFLSRDGLDAAKCCAVCQSRDHPEHEPLLFCDLCNVPLHPSCSTPKVTSVPKTEWFCATCDAHWNASTAAIIAKKESPTTTATTPSS